MADTVRKAVAARFSYNNHIAEDDLYQRRADDSFIVHTNTVAMLDHLSRNCPHPLVITALNEDHGDSRPGDPWSHRGGGAVDVWHRNWAQVGDAEIETVLRNVAINPYVLRVGFGGFSQRYYGAAFWPARIIQFYDNSSDHVHLETGPGAPY